MNKIKAYNRIVKLENTIDNKHKKYIDMISVDKVKVLFTNKKYDVLFKDDGTMKQNIIGGNQNTFNYKSLDINAGLYKDSNIKVL